MTHLKQMHQLDLYHPDLSDRYTMSITSQWCSLDPVEQSVHAISNSDLWQSWNLLQHYIEAKINQGDL